MALLEGFGRERWLNDRVVPKEWSGGMYGDVSSKEEGT